MIRAFFPLRLHAKRNVFSLYAPFVNYFFRSDLFPHKTVAGLFDIKYSAFQRVEFCSQTSNNHFPSIENNQEGEFLEAHTLDFNAFSNSKNAFDHLKRVVELQMAKKPHSPKTQQMENKSSKETNSLKKGYKVSGNLKKVNATILADLENALAANEDPIRDEKYCDIMCRLAASTRNVSLLNSILGFMWNTVQVPPQMSHLLLQLQTQSFHKLPLEELEEKLLLILEEFPWEKCSLVTNEAHNYLLKSMIQRSNSADPKRLSFHSKVVRHMKKQNIAPNEKTLDHLCVWGLRKRNMNSSQCESWIKWGLDHGVQVPIKLYHLLISSENHQEKDEKWTQELIEKMEKNNTPLENSTLELLFKTQAELEQPNVELCQKIHDTMVEKGVEPSNKAANLLLKVYSKAVPSNPELVFQILQTVIDKMDKMDKKYLVQSFGFAIRAASNALHSDPEVCRGLFNRMLQLGLSPNIHILDSIIFAYSTWGKCDLSDYMDILRKMKSHGVTPSVMIYNHIMNDFSSRIPAEDIFCIAVLKMLEADGLQPTNSILTFLLKAHAKTSPPNIKACQDAMNLFKKYNLVLNITHYNTLMNAFAEGDPPNVTSCSSVLEFIRQNGIKPSIASYNIVIKAHIRSLNPRMQKCEEIFESIIVSGLKPTIVTFNLILDGYIIKHNLDGIFHTIERMNQRGIRPNHETINEIRKLAFAIDQKQTVQMQEWKKIYQKLCEMGVELEGLEGLLIEQS